MTKKSANLSLNTKQRIEDKPNGSDYFYFSELVKTLSVLLSPLISSLSFSAEPNSKNTNLSNGYSKNTTLNMSRSFNSKKHDKTSRPYPNTLTIDLHNIEKNLSLSPNEKRKLKQILNEIRFENGGGVDLKNGRPKSKVPKKGKTTGKTKCDDSSCKANKELENSICGIKVVDNSFKTFDKTDSNFNTCKTYENVFNEYNRKSFKALKKLDTTNQQFSTPKPSVPKGNVGACVKYSSSKTRTIVRAKPNRNLANLRLKYINPIYMVQYSTKSSHDYSQAALKAHLGEGHCPLVNDPHSEHAMRNMSMHEEDDEKYVIAKGTLTEELVESFKALKEIRRSIFPRSQSRSFSSEEESPRLTRCSTRKKTVRMSVKEAEPKHNLEPDVILKPSNISLFFPSPEEDLHNKPHWDVESFPSTLHNLEKDTPTLKRPAEKSEERFQSDTSIYSKLKGCFFKTWFCLCFNHDSKTLDKKNYTIPKNRTKLKKRNTTPSSRFRSNIKIIRTTESEFLYTNPKTK